MCCICDTYTNIRFLLNIADFGLSLSAAQFYLLSSVRHKKRKHGSRHNHTATPLFLLVVDI